MVRMCYQTVPSPSVGICWNVSDFNLARIERTALDEMVLRKKKKQVNVGGIFFEGMTPLLGSDPNTFNLKPLKPYIFFSSFKKSFGL